MEMEAREEELGLGIVVENGGGHSHEHGVFCERLGEEFFATVGKVNVQQVSELEEGEIPVLENHLDSSLGSWVEKKFADGKNTELVQSKEQGNPSFNGSVASPTPDETSRIPIEGKENGSEEEEKEEDEDDMVEEDSDPLMESAAHESSDTSDNEEDEEVEVNDAIQKHNRDRATELEKLVVGGDEESGDEEVISMEPPRTTHELKVHFLQIM
jgi:hypothetical protein